MNHEEILQFWFEEIKPSQIWIKDASFDQLIIDRYTDIYQQAICCELYHWRETPQGRLAEIIVLDQFSRNMFRESAKAFKFDALALALSQQALKCGDDQKLDKQKRGFMYLPFMHSESREIHKQALKIYTRHGVKGSLDFEVKHKNIIDKFGRYPHRNKVLGRQSTDEEIEFLKGSNSGF